MGRTTIPTIDFYQYRSAVLGILNDVPFINPVDTPGTFNPWGSLGYDYQNSDLYFNNNGSWELLSAATGPIGPTGPMGVTGPVGPIGPTGPSTVDSYGIIKSGDQTIPTLTWTQLISFTDTPSPPYSSMSGWILASGKYVNTSLIAQDVSFIIDISWKANVSSQGKRFMRMMYDPSPGGSPISIKETNTLPDSFKGIETTQEMAMKVTMNPGDAVWIEVYHDAPISLLIEGGVGSSYCGMRVT